MEKKGLLVVSFGTSFDATREKTIDRIEADLSEVFSDRRFYRGWTLVKIAKEMGLTYNTVVGRQKRALEKLREMLADHRS